MKCKPNMGCNRFFEGKCQGLCGQPQSKFLAKFRRLNKAKHTNPTTQPSNLVAKVSFN